uniref:Uncharacterized protein n=1 Tax=Arundo donax TaxID=35708 RepID=A0A0A8XQ78_ARUDO
MPTVLITIAQLSPPITIAQLSPPMLSGDALLCCWLFYYSDLRNVVNYPQIWFRILCC